MHPTKQVSLAARPVLRSIKQNISAEPVLAGYPNLRLFSAIHLGVVSVSLHALALSAVVFCRWGALIGSARPNIEPVFSLKQWRGVIRWPCHWVRVVSPRVTSLVPRKALEGASLTCGVIGEVHRERLAASRVPDEGGAPMRDDPAGVHNCA